MSNLINFNFENHELNTVVIDGQIWFPATALATALGFANPRQAIATHTDKDDVQKLDALTVGGKQKVNFVNESGMYALIFGSTKDEAKRFKRWVTSEVLPSIRKTGSYTVAPVYPVVSVINPPAPSHGELYKTFIATVNLQGVMTMRELGDDEFVTTYDDLPNLLRYRSWGVSDEKMAKIAKAALNKITGEWD